ncbi:hypothetical protein HYPDE_37243 [Hyphomicrobium denitrificans 1NES1]|uniref:Uncharacterized protein n=1 Tax=Hyphomicrobium denitrificans 1NES1 TaxID=670307 RepID=N0BG77_9HYPH|nr:hypothetical protein HYPDE_37243 [Hyphomicrobium denitrificans 1NES1]
MIDPGCHAVTTQTRQCRLLIGAKLLSDDPTCKPHRKRFSAFRAHVIYTPENLLDEHKGAFAIALLWLWGAP